VKKIFGVAKHFTWNAATFDGDRVRVRLRNRVELNVKGKIKKIIKNVMLDKLVGMTQPKSI